MTENRYLCFLSDIGKEKFMNQGGESPCPFCNRGALSDILDEAYPLVLLKNKYATFANTQQTVLIETDDCAADMAVYEPVHMQKIITFGTDHWLAMEQSGEYKSVAFFKNHGPLSGGSIGHAHMQIVGLKDIDYKRNLNADMFDGIEIVRKGNCVLNISTRPNACATEFNVITAPRNDRFMAHHVQNLVRYVLDRCSSFNLFFYQWNESIICKIVPRYVTSPFLIGFNIPQTSSRLHQIAEEVKRMID
ncbi:DUF4931 domain-containing protein [bacterium]|nr:DUF4931 domain-containing protein [bacterium]